MYTLRGKNNPAQPRAWMFHNPFNAASENSWIFIKPKSNIHYEYTEYSLRSRVDSPLPFLINSSACLSACLSVFFSDWLVSTYNCYWSKNCLLVPDFPFVQTSMVLWYCWPKSSNKSTAYISWSRRLSWGNLKQKSHQSNIHKQAISHLSTRSASY